MSKLTGVLGGLGKVALGVGAGGLLALGAGLAKTISVGLGFNNAMEQAAAKINAFTKDAGLTAEILKTVQERAAKTPFAFDEMANSAAALMPTVRASGESLEFLLEKAEILAASNPMEGLEGASFALKEAVSGDFTSIVERFNLSRSTLKKLKDQGVPALEAVGIAMAELGLDTDLVTALANTAEGRWSTFKDTLTALAGTVTQPIFDSFSGGLGGVNDWLTTITPQLQNFAEMLAGRISQGITSFATKAGGLNDALQGIFKVLSGGKGAVQEFTGLRQMGFDTETAKLITDITRDIRELFETFQTSGAGGLAVALGVPQETLDTITTVATKVDEILTTIAGHGGFGLAGILIVDPEAREILKGITDEVARLFDVLTGGAEEGGEGGGFSAIFEDMKTSFAEGLPTLSGEILAGIPAALTTITDGIGEFFKENVPAFQEVLGPWVTSFWTWADNAAQGAGEAMLGVLLALTAWATGPEAATSLNGVGEGIGKAIVTSLSLFFENAPEMGATLFKLVAALAMGAIGLTANLLIIGAQIAAGIMDGILQSFGIDLQPAAFSELSAILGNIGRDGSIIAMEAGKEIAKGFEKLGDIILSALIPGFTALKSKLKPIFEDTFKETKDLFSGEKWMELGTSAIEGLLEGMKEKAGEVLEFIKSLAMDSLSGLGQFWGAKSPATEFMPLGASVPQGIAVGINSAAGLATQAIQGMGRNLLTSTSSALSFIDDLDMGGLARGFGTGGGQWRNFRNILKNEIMGGMGALADGTADVMDSVYKVAARFNFPPGMAAEFAEANGLVEHLTGNFEKFRQQMNIENLGNMTQMAASFSGLGSTFADMLTQQMAGGEGAIKTMEAYRKLTGEIGTQETQMATLQEELEALNAATERDTAAIEKKQKAIEKLTGEMEKNQKAIVATSENYAALQAQAFDLFSGSQTEAQRVGSELATIALLEDFLRSGDSSFLIPSDAVSQAAGITGILYDQISGQAELNRLVAEQAEREALITEQKEAQQKLDFLKSQLDLLKLGQSLGGDIFQGITFGLNASVEDMLAAVNAVTMAMVDQIDHDLGIASPSKLLFDKFKNQIGGAMVGGLLAVKPMMEGAIQPILNPIMQGANAAGRVVNNYFNQTVNTRADSSSVIGDFRTMQLMAG